MTDTIAQNVGIDISKAHLDVATFPDGEYCQFSNDNQGHKELGKWLLRFDFDRVVFEATGPYHRKLEQFLNAQQLVYAKVNPRQARRFAEATGKLVKTDRVDALMLARFGALLQPSETIGKTQSIEELSELVVARRALIKDRTAARNRLQCLTSSLLKQQVDLRLQQIKQDIKTIDLTCEKIIKSDDTLLGKAQIISSIPGIGPIATKTMLAEMPELGSMDKRQTASLAGLAPITRQSGKWSGKSYIRGGRANLRHALYMPALVAINHNKELKIVYQKMIAAGKPPKLAITAIMRRLIIIANALLRDQRKWTENIA